MAPCRSRTCVQRLAIDPISFAGLGYELHAFTTFLVHCSKGSLPVSISRTVGSARDQTFSCGFKSGEYLGQCGSTVMFHSLYAALATGACRIGSESKMILKALSLGNDFFKKGPTLFFTSFAQTSAVQGDGTQKCNILPLDVVRPKTFCFFTFCHSFLGNHFLGR